MALRRRWRISTTLTIPAVLVAAGCSLGSPKSQYLLAEHLWSEGKYAAAVTEFEKVANRDPGGKLGLQAMYRAGLTETLFLSDHVGALNKFKVYVKQAGDTPTAWLVQKQIGEILFLKLDRYDEAIEHYRNLLAMKPAAPEAPEFLYRIGRSQFFLSQFSRAVQTYEQLSQKYPGTPWAEQAAFDIALTQFTAGRSLSSSTTADAKGSSSYKDAIASYRAFIARYPKSKKVPEAMFGIASCLEEMDQLEAAYDEYKSIVATYPSPNVIQIKLARIHERMMQRQHPNL